MALFRNATLQVWAESHHEGRLIELLTSPRLFAGPVRQAMGSNAVIDDPPCASYPTAVSLRKMEPALADFLAKAQFPTKASYYFVLTYTGPCKVTASYPDGTTKLLVSFDSVLKAIGAGALETPYPIGDIWHFDAVAGCTATGLPSGAC